MRTDFRRSVSGSPDGFSDAGIGTASADITLHSCVDVGIGRMRIGFKQCHGRHDLTTLAVPTLGYLFGNPRFLHWMRIIDGNSFNRYDRLPVYGRHRKGTGSDGSFVEMHRAGTTLGNPTAVFCSGQSNDIPDNPKQRHLGIGVNRVFFSVDG
jgi:hypothetical protein